ncbi:MAG: hypothetical protein QM783_18930 [Phycisphaerales bacterium]
MVMPLVVCRTVIGRCCATLAIALLAVWYVCKNYCGIAALSPNREWCVMVVWGGLDIVHAPSGNLRAIAIGTAPSSCLMLMSEAPSCILYPTPSATPPPPAPPPAPPPPPSWEFVCFAPGASIMPSAKLNVHLPPKPIWWLAVPPALFALYAELARALGRRQPGRCRTCGYALAGLSVPICPECGMTST